VSSGPAALARLAGLFIPRQQDEFVVLDCFRRGIAAHNRADISESARLRQPAQAVDRIDPPPSQTLSRMHVWTPQACALSKLELRHFRRASCRRRHLSMAAIIRWSKLTTFFSRH
jgi:hypothetical protein